MSWNNVVFFTAQSLIVPQPNSSRTCSLSACPRILAIMLAASSQEVSCGDRIVSPFSDVDIRRQVDASDGRQRDIGRMWGSESCESHSISEILSVLLKSILGPARAGSTCRRSNCALSSNVLIGGSLSSGSDCLCIGGGSVRERKCVSTGGVGAWMGEATGFGGGRELAGGSDPDRKLFISASETPFCASSWRSFRLSSCTRLAVCWISFVTSTPFLSYSWILLFKSSTNSL